MTRPPMSPPMSPPTRPPVPARGTGPDQPALLRLSVVGGSRRVDVVVPGAVPAVELLPDLARRLGVASGQALRLQTLLGRAVDPSLGLAVQGVVDGAVLALAGQDDPGADTGVDREADPVDDPSDDLPEAVAGVVLQPSAGTSGGAPPGASWVTGAVLVLGGAGLLASLLPWRGHDAVGVDPASAIGVLVAGSGAALLLATAALRRSRRRVPGSPGSVSPVLLAWAACAYAAIAAIAAAAATTTPAGPSDVLPAAGLGALGVGAVCLAGARAGGGRRSLLAPVLVSGTCAATGVVRVALGVDPQTVLLVAATAAVLLLRLVPAWLVGPLVRGRPLAGADGAPRGQPGPRGRDRPRDPVRLEQDVHAALGLVATLVATAGTLLSLAAPSAVGRGATGAALVGASGVVVLLQARHHRDRGVVVACVGGAMATLCSTWVALVVQQSVAVPYLAAVLVPVAIAVPYAAGSGWSPRLRRTAGQVETVAVLALLPLLVLALDAPTVLATGLR